MNTNAKHYEELNIQPWDIMEKNWSTQEFVAYLKGNIIKYALRNKGQDLSDAEKIKHYAEKLIEVIEKKETDEFLKEDAERIYGKQEKPEEVEEVEDKPKFKVGDRVIVSDDTLAGNKKATVVHLRDKGILGYRYLVELDEKGAGWEANKVEHGINCRNAWSVIERKLELLSEKPKSTLIPNKWYDAETFTVEELKELLPVGTKIFVIKEYTTNNNDYNEAELAKETWLKTIVQRVDKKHMTKLTRVAIPDDIFFRRYFRIVGED